VRPRFDSRPLVLRRKYTATMRHTVVLEWPSQARHALHLFCIICAGVMARNVANQEVQDAFGPQIMGKLYLAVALIAGITVAAAGWLGRNHDTRSVTRLIHFMGAVAMAAAFFVPRYLLPVLAMPQASLSWLPIANYVAMEVAFATMLLAFGMTLGASLGPREARKVAAGVGAGGIIGGLVGNLVSLGALWFGSELLYVIAGAVTLAPVFWLPATHVATDVSHSRNTQRIDLSRERTDVPALAKYGLAVAATTVLMVAATTFIDYQYRWGAHDHYAGDKKTAFFAAVGLGGGVITVLFQLGVLNRMLNKLGLFGTAVVMPVALISCSAAFGLFPTLITLVVLKVVDSGANMSLQQATGHLLLAPLAPRARAVWQGRIDGLAKRGSQAVAGLLLALFPLAPPQVLPWALVVCALWMVSIIFTRSAYVRLLTDMLGVVTADPSKLEVYDGATLRFLETELAKATPARAAVILDLFEKAGHRAPGYLLQRQIDKDPEGVGAIRVIEHLTTVADVETLIRFARADDGRHFIAAAALLALADLEPRVAQHRSRQILSESKHAEGLRATAAGIMAQDDRRALKLARELAGARDSATRLAIAQALGRSDPGDRHEIDEIIMLLACDRDTEVARAAVETLGNRPTPEACDVALKALGRRAVRGAAMRALANMGQAVVDRVAEELREQIHRPEVASTLTWILGRLGAASGVGPLVDALDSPIVSVRLNAAVALSTMHRRRPDVLLPKEKIETHYLSEIEYYSTIRDASLAALPDSPSGTLFSRALKQRGHSSLETLFRMMSLHYPEDAMQGAFVAINSREKRQQQIALELLDNILDKSVSERIAEAIGAASTGRRRQRQEPQNVLAKLTTDPDRFLASLARATLLDMGASSPEARRIAETTGEIMAQTVVNQILELQSLTLFSHSSAEDLAEVATFVTARRVPKGTVLFREGEVGDAIYLVRTGEVTMSKAGKILDNIGPGEACGIIAVLDQLPRELSATVSMESSLLVIRGDDLLQLLADRPLLMHSVFRALTAALRNQLGRGALGRKPEDWSW